MIFVSATQSAQLEGYIAYDISTGEDPPDNYVVTRNKDSSPRSYYGDDRLDLTPYNGIDRTVTIGYHFWGDEETTIHKVRLQKLIRWYIFLLFTKHEIGLSIGSLQKYQLLLHSAARYCDTSGISFNQFFSSKIHVIGFLKLFPYLASKLGGFINFINQLGPKISRLDYVKASIIDIVRKVRKDYSNSRKQHSPLPQRIYSELLSRCYEDLEEFDSISDRVIDLYRRCAEDPFYGRSIANQFKVKRSLKLDCVANQPNFPKLLSEFDLESFWEGKGYIKAVSGLSKLLTEVLTTSSILIQAFTGMRAGEVGSLPYDCLVEYKKILDKSTRYLINGYVTKPNGGKKMLVQWVTCKTGVFAINIAKKISNAIYLSKGINVDDSMKSERVYGLFISPSIISEEHALKQAHLTLCNMKLLRNRIQPIVTEEDILELENIDMHRAWRSEDSFKVGEPWVFTTHQLRRSLALYAHRSGLVTIPSLKKQLKQITQLITYFYCNGSSNAKPLVAGHQDHFFYEWEQTQYLAEFLDYEKSVLQEGQPLKGPHIHWVNAKLKNDEGVIEYDREATMLRFKKGQQAYVSTVIGGCTKVGACDKSPLDITHSGCISSNCKNLVVNIDKLKRLIEVEITFVEQLKVIDSASSEYRQSQDNLQLLQAALI